MAGHIVVVPFPHPGHIFPATELCRRLADRNYNITLFLPSTSSPSSLSLHPLIRTLEFPLPHPTRIPPGLLELSLPDLLASHLKEHRHRPPICVIVDEMISWLFDYLTVPAVALFSSSAYTEAVDHSEPRAFKHHRRGAHHHGGGPHSRGPRRPRGLAGARGAVALLVNTCDELERPYLERMAVAAGCPVWGVGPLLPAGFWSPGTSAEADIRPRSSVSEADVRAWLDARPRASVIYISFGTLVVPTDEELAELAAGLLASGRAFIWVVQAEPTRFGPDGGLLRSNDENSVSPGEIARLAGEKGMVITGWAPQLAILRHSATGAFVCHCGWNSTVEALASGVPVLAWPVRGDQFDNARLVTERLGAGCAVKVGEEEAVSRGDVVKGIERVLTDEGIRKGATAAREVFAAGFPKSSVAAVDAFLDFVSADASKN